MKANRSTGLPARIALVASVVALLAACSSLLDVKDPDVINPPDVLNADGAVAAYNGGIGDFAFANDGDNGGTERSEEHTSELQSLAYLVCRLLLQKKKQSSRRVGILVRQAQY